MLYIYTCRGCHGHLETDEKINARSERCLKCMKCKYFLEEKIGCNGAGREKEVNSKGE